MGMEIRVWLRSRNKVVTMNLEDYIKQVLPNEVYGSWPKASLEANAIMARSFALYHINNPKYPAIGADVCDTTASQRFIRDSNTTRTDAAVNATKGFVLVDKDSEKVVQAFYSASCGGSGLTGWGPRNLRGHIGCPCADHKHQRYGHGHGGCQWGTKYLAEGGASVEDILYFYFKNVRIVSNYGNEKEMEEQYEEFFDSLGVVEILGIKFYIKV